MEDVEVSQELLQKKKIFKNISIEHAWWKKSTGGINLEVCGFKQKIRIPAISTSRLRLAIISKL